MHRELRNRKGRRRSIASGAGMLQLGTSLDLSRSAECEVPFQKASVATSERTLAAAAQKKPQPAGDYGRLLVELDSETNLAVAL